MDTNRYKLSFTAASLSLSESVTIAEVYLHLREWDQVKERVRQGNLLQSRTGSSAVRTYRELAQRLQTLSDRQLECLVACSTQEQKYILWYAICKRYAFIREFAMEVLYEKAQKLEYDLTELEYEAFFHRKADWHSELDEIRETTRKKLKQVLFRMLRETGLMSKQHGIIPALLSGRLVEIIQKDESIDYTIFPVTHNAIQR